LGKEPRKGERSPRGSLIVGYFGRTKQLVYYFIYRILSIVGKNNAALRFWALSHLNAAAYRQRKEDLPCPHAGGHDYVFIYSHTPKF